MTNIWQSGMPAWTAIGEVEPFKAYVMHLDGAWHYTDEGRKTVGPVSVSELSQRFNNGDVDGMTVVWSKCINEWKALREVDVLREILHEIEDEQSKAAALVAMEKEEKARKQQALEGEDDDLKTFVADDGKTYMMSETEGMVEVPAALKEASKDGGDEGKEKEKAKEPVKELTAEEKELKEKRRLRNERKKAAKKRKAQQWKKSKVQTWIYITGLPEDATAQTVEAYFTKCGVIATNAEGKPKIKLYKNDEGALKGDASIGYLKPESVQLAVEMLDQAEVKAGFKLTVQPAQFEQKGSGTLYTVHSYTHTLIHYTLIHYTEFVQKKLKVTGEGKVALKRRSDALSWNDGIDDGSGLKIIIIKHLFRPDDFRDPTFEDELQSDIESECGKFGEFKCTIFEKHPEGVVSLKYSEGAAAEQCIGAMDGRCTRCALAVHSLYTHCTPTVHPLYTHYTPTVHPLYTHYTPTIHSLYTHYTPTIHSLHTHYTPTIHSLHTHYTPTNRYTPTIRIISLYTIDGQVLRWAEIDLHLLGRGDRLHAQGHEGGRGEEAKRVR
jgi:HIV Tat-specific factor 1